MIRHVKSKTTPAYEILRYLQEASPSVYYLTGARGHGRAHYREDWCFFAEDKKSIRDELELIGFKRLPTDDETFIKHRVLATTNTPETWHMEFGNINIIVHLAADIDSEVVARELAEDDCLKKHHEYSPERLVTYANRHLFTINLYKHRLSSAQSGPQDTITQPTSLEAKTV